MVGKENFTRIALAGVAAVGLAAFLGSQKDAGATGLKNETVIATTFSGPLPTPTGEQSPKFVIKTPTPPAQEFPKTETPEHLPTAISYLSSNDGGEEQQIELRKEQIQEREGVTLTVCQNCYEAPWNGEDSSYLVRVKEDNSFVPLYQVSHNDGHMGVIVDIRKVEIGADGQPFYAEETERQAMLLPVLSSSGEGQDMVIISGEGFSKYMPPEGKKFKEDIVASADYEKILVYYAKVQVEELNDGDKKFTENVVAVYNPVKAKFVIGGPGDILEKIELE